MRLRWWIVAYLLVLAVALLAPLASSAPGRTGTAGRERGLRRVSERPAILDTGGLRFSRHRKRDLGGAAGRMGRRDGDVSARRRPGVYGKEASRPSATERPVAQMSSRGLSIDRLRRRSQPGPPRRRQAQVRRNGRFHRRGHVPSSFRMDVPGGILGGCMAPCARVANWPGAYIQALIDRRALLGGRRPDDIHVRGPSPPVLGPGSFDADTHARGPGVRGHHHLGRGG